MPCWRARNASRDWGTARPKCMPGCGRTTPIRRPPGKWLGSYLSSVGRRRRRRTAPPPRRRAGAERRGETGVRKGILGGTFNPPHIAHLIVAQEVREAMDLDGVVLVPTSIHAFKGPASADPRHRA